MSGENKKRGEKDKGVRNREVKRIEKEIEKRSKRREK